MWPFAKTKKHQRFTKKRPLRLEALEQRRLMTAVTFDVSNPPGLMYLGTGPGIVRHLTGLA